MNDNDISLDSVADSARMLVTPYHKVINELLPIERNVLMELDHYRSMIASGDAVLDKKYPRIEVPAVLASRRKQKGIPYPVPKFALFNVDKEPVSKVSCQIRVERLKASRAATEGGFYGAALTDNMAEAARRRCRNFRATLWFSLLFLGVGLLIGQSFFPEWSWSWQRVFMIVFGILDCLAAAVYGALILGIEDAHLICTETISVGFSGVLPNNTRAKVKDAKNMGMAVSLLCEVDPKIGWKREITSKPGLKADPLVVGLKDGAWYLIDKFDITPAEHWIASEMTSGN